MTGPPFHRSWRAKPAVVNGASRSDVNTKGHLLTLNLRRLEHYTPPEVA